MPVLRELFAKFPTHGTFMAIPLHPLSTPTIIATYSTHTYSNKLKYRRRSIIGKGAGENSSRQDYNRNTSHPAVVNWENKTRHYTKAWKYVVRPNPTAGELLQLRGNQLWSSSDGAGPLCLLIPANAVGFCRKRRILFGVPSTDFVSNRRCEINVFACHEWGIDGEAVMDKLVLFAAPFWCERSPRLGAKKDLYFETVGNHKSTAISTGFGASHYNKNTGLKSSLWKSCWSQKYWVMVLQFCTFIFIWLVVIKFWIGA